MRMLVAVLAAFAAMFAPEAALGSTTGLQPGVHVDPGSPAGKEYQIPIAAARGEAAAGSSQGSANPPLFGVGVTPPGGSAGTGATSGGSRASGSGGSAKPGSERRSDAHSQSAAGDSAGSGTASAAPARRSSSALAATSSRTPGGNGWVALVGGGLLVLVLGGGGGLAIRQRALRG